MRFLLRMLGRVVLFVAVILFILFLWRPAFIVNAGNVLFHAAGNSTAYGSAMVVPSLQGQSGSIQVSLQGLTSNLHYVITLNQGSCDGSVLKTFTSVTSDTSGNVSNSFSLADLKLTTQPNLWINVHEGSSAGATVACGQVQINNNLLTQSQTTKQASSGSTKQGSTTTTTTAATATPVSASAAASPTTTGSSGFTNSSSSSDTVGDGNLGRRRWNNPDLPHTGVAPGDDNTYNDYKGPHKY